jgi:hypothetical protein
VRRLFRRPLLLQLLLVRRGCLLRCRQRLVLVRRERLARLGVAVRLGRPLWRCRSLLPPSWLQLLLRLMFRSRRQLRMPRRRSRRHLPRLLPLLRRLATTAPVLRRRPVLPAAFVLRGR